MVKGPKMSKDVFVQAGADTGMQNAEVERYVERMDAASSIIHPSMKLLQMA